MKQTSTPGRPALHLGQVFTACAALFLFGCAHNRNDTASVEPAPVFQQTLKGHMAELGQYMDDVYRFWDSKTMHEVSLQRLDLMLEIHDRCLAIYRDYLEQHSIVEYRDQQIVFENYLLKSKQLTLSLKEAVISKDDALITEAFANLDQNRRDAHSQFGEAL